VASVRNQFWAIDFSSGGRTWGGAQQKLDEGFSADEFGTAGLEAE
jgi:hypothetical protein